MYRVGQGTTDTAGHRRTRGRARAEQSDHTGFPTPPPPPAYGFVQGNVNHAHLSDPATLSLVPGVTAV